MEEQAFEMEDPVPEIKWPRKRKAKGKKEDKIRNAKVTGEEHINHVRKLIPARTTGEDCR